MLVCSFMMGDKGGMEGQGSGRTGANDEDEEGDGVEHVAHVGGRKVVCAKLWMVFGVPARGIRLRGDVRECAQAVVNRMRKERQEAWYERKERKER